MCHPMLPPHLRKAWFYIVPVVVMAFALNAPKFLEVQLKFEVVNGTEYPTYTSTELRHDETYIRCVSKTSTVVILNHTGVQQVLDT